MAYDTIAAVDENYSFPEQVQNNLLANRGFLSAGDNLDNIRKQGIYSISNTVASTLLNAPKGISTSTLMVLETGQASGMMQTQIIYAVSRGGSWVRDVQNTTGTWNDWAPLSWDRGNLPGYTDFNTITTSGHYRISSRATATTMLNAPAMDDACSLEVFAVDSPDSGTRITQVVWTNGPSGTMYVRNTLDDSLTFGEWKNGSGGSDNYWAQHSLRVSEFKRRRGGLIGTYGRGAVAFRFDHNWDDFIATNGIASLMEKYGIVGSMAVPAVEFDSAYSNGSTTGSFATMQKWALEHGMEIMSHSYTHEDAQTPTALVHEIEQSRDYLESQMPQIKVDVWAQPGTVAPTGKETYAGMGPVTRIENLYGSQAGRMLLGAYAVVGGHMDGYYRELTGDVDQGLAHYTIETETSSANVVSMLNLASKAGVGLVLMMHPNVIGTAGKMSLSVLEEIFQHVANMRDKGLIQNLTVGGMSLADVSSDRRRDLVFDGTFINGFEDWSAGGGWIISNGKPVAGGTGVLQQGEYWSRRAALAGSWNELVVDVETINNTVLELRVWDDKNPTVLDITKQFTISSGSLRTCRLPFGIPYVGGATTPATHPKWSIKRVSGGALTLSRVRVQAI